MEIAPVVTIAKVVKEDDEATADKEPSQPLSQQQPSQPGIKIKDFARMPEAPQPPQGDAAAAALGARRKLSTSTNRLGQVRILM